MTIPTGRNQRPEDSARDLKLMRWYEAGYSRLDDEEYEECAPRGRQKANTRLSTEANWSCTKQCNVPLSPAVSDAQV